MSERSIKVKLAEPRDVEHGRVVELQFEKGNITNIERLTTWEAIGLIQALDGLVFASGPISLAQRGRKGAISEIVHAARVEQEENDGDG